MKEEKGAEFSLPQTERIRGHLWNRYSVMGHDGDQYDLRSDDFNKR